MKTARNYCSCKYLGTAKRHAPTVTIVHAYDTDTSSLAVWGFFIFGGFRYPTQDFRCLSFLNMSLLCIAYRMLCAYKVNVNQGKIVIEHGYFKIF